MSSFTNRFHAAQTRASRLFCELGSQRITTIADSRSDIEDVRVAGFVALQHVNYACERVMAGLKSLRKQKDQPPIITPDDYERFLERCFGIAEALGVSSDRVASGFVAEAELALKHAEDAIRQARKCYSGTGKTLDM